MTSFFWHPAEPGGRAHQVLLPKPNCCPQARGEEKEEREEQEKENTKERDWEMATYGKRDEGRSDRKAKQKEE